MLGWPYTIAATMSRVGLGRVAAHPTAHPRTGCQSGCQTCRDWLDWAGLLDTGPDYPLLAGLGRIVWTENVGLLIRRFWVQVPGGVPLSRPLTRGNAHGDAPTTGPRCQVGA